MNKDSEILNPRDVIAVSQKFKGEFSSGNTLKIHELIEEYKEHIYRSKGVNNSNANIFNNYIECEVLKEDGKYKGWKKGKIKFVIQFEPDATEDNQSPDFLDDIRKEIDNTN